MNVLNFKTSQTAHYRILRKLEKVINKNSLALTLIICCSIQGKIKAAGVYLIPSEISLLKPL